MRKILILFAILALAFITTIASIKYRRSYSAATGNVCDVSTNNPRGLCFEDRPVGGFPFSYVYDSGGVSVPYSFGPEDHYYREWFIADIAFYFVIISLIYSIGRAIRKKFFAIV